MPKLSRTIVIVAAKRTAFGTMQGSLKGLSANDLGVVAAKAALAQSGVAAADIGHVVFGNVLQSSADAIYCARHIGLKAGLPITTPALTVNRLCGSGFEAIVQGAQQLLLGEHEAVLVGGTENMTQAPHVIRGAREGFAFGKARSSRTRSGRRSPTATATRRWPSRRRTSRRSTASRARSATSSRCRASKGGLAAEERGPLQGRDCAVSLSRRRERRVSQVDEHPRPQTTLETLAELGPVFKKDGVVTAGNASGICDGAAALVLRPRSSRRRRGCARSRSSCNGASPASSRASWASGPRPAIPARSHAPGSSCPTSTASRSTRPSRRSTSPSRRSSGLDRAKTNVNGGAIALGHPLGRQRRAHHGAPRLRAGAHRRPYAVGSACIGGGQGIAVVLERPLGCRGVGVQASDAARRHLAFGEDAWSRHPRSRGAAPPATMPTGGVRHRVRGAGRRRRRLGNTHASVPGWTFFHP